MFLNPSAKPAPRRTPSPRVVLPAPPGSRSGSRGSSSGAGRVSAAARRITSGSAATRDDLAGRKEVARLERVEEPHSTGSISSSAASRSICASRREARLDRPGPRIAPQGGLFVRPRSTRARVVDAIWAVANEAAFDATAVELEAYAPPSSRIRSARTSDARRASRGARSAYARGDDGRARRTTPRARRRSAPRGSCGARATRRGSASRDPRGRRRRRPRRRGGCAPARAGGRGRARPGRGPRAATASPRNVDATLAVGHRKARLRAEEGLVLDAELVCTVTTTSPGVSGSPCRITR